MVSMPSQETGRRDLLATAHWSTWHLALIGYWRALVRSPLPGSGLEEITESVCVGKGLRW